VDALLRVFFCTNIETQGPLPPAILNPQFLSTDRQIECKTDDRRPLAVLGGNQHGLIAKPGAWGIAWCRNRA
jgi:hypothetical protein